MEVKDKKEKKEVEKNLKDKTKTPKYTKPKKKHLII